MKKLHFGSSTVKPIDKSINKLNPVNPVNPLKATLSNLSKSKLQTQIHSQSQTQLEEKAIPFNPTMNYISKYTFEEQSSNIEQETMEQFSSMLDELANSVGREVGENLHKCLTHIKEHAFLADILKPESINTMVTAMRKSYGHVVAVKSKNAEKRVEKNEILDSIAGTLADLNF